MVPDEEDVKGKLGASFVGFDETGAGVVAKVGACNALRRAALGRAICNACE